MKSVSSAKPAGLTAAMLLVLATIGLAGCVGAVPSISAGDSPSVASPAVAPSDTAAPSGWPTYQLAYTPASSPSTVPTSVDTPTPTSTPLPAAATDPISNVPAAPAGAWTSVRWSYLGTPSWIQASSSLQVFGWSRGYIGFAIGPAQGTQQDPAVIPYSSADGVHWSKGQALNTAAAGTQGGLSEIRSVLEGPAGLLAVGWTGACSTEFLDGLWTSSDGKSWRPVNIQAQFGPDAVGRIATVSGGSTGFTAVAYQGAAVWTSADGATWHSVALNSSAFTGSKINDATAFASGYVLAGTYGKSDCGTSVGPQPTPAPRTASTWWSADGTAWTRASLPGAPTTSGGQSMWLCRITDQSVLMVDDLSNSRLAWASVDGRNWTAVSLPTDIWPADVLTDGHHVLVVGSAGNPSQVGPMTLRTFNSHFGLETVNQIGSLPSIAYQAWSSYSMFDSFGHVAVGPTGVVVTDGAQLWIGLPS